MRGAAHHQSLAVGRPRRAAQIDARRQGPRQPTGARLPEVPAAIGERQRLAVRCPGETRRRADRRRETQSPRQCTPQAYLVVALRRRCQCLAVGLPGDVPDRPRVSLHRVQRPPGPGVPEAKRAILAAGGEHLAVGRPGEGGDAPFVPFEREERPTAARIEEEHGAALPHAQARTCRSGDQATPLIGPARRSVRRSRPDSTCHSRTQPSTPADARNRLSGAHARTSSAFGWPP